MQPAGQDTAVAITHVQHLQKSTLGLCKNELYLSQLKDGLLIDSVKRQSLI